MNILGREVTRDKLVRRVRQELEDRGLIRSVMEISVRAAAQAVAQRPAGPLAVALEGLGHHADPTVPLGDTVQPEGPLAQWVDRLARRAVRALAPELLGRQRAFNAQLRDACTLLGAELVRLRAEVDSLRAAQARAAKSTPTPHPGPEAVTPSAPEKAAGAPLEKPPAPPDSSLGTEPRRAPPKVASAEPLATPVTTGTAKPAAAKSTRAKPAGSTPAATGPAASKPSASKPAASKPTASKPTASKPTASSAAPRRSAPRKAAPRRR
jgi:hypothetical protein